MSDIAATALAPRNPDALGLLIAGETNLQNRDDPTTAFAAVQPIFDRADLRICHLEGLLAEPSSDPRRPDIPHKPLWRHSGARMGKALVSAGIDAVSCASNVSYPWHAVPNGIAALDKAGIAYAGIGMTRAKSRRPAIIESNGTRIALLSYTSVFWPSDHAAEAERPGTATLPARTAYGPGRRALEMPGAPPEVETWVEDDVIEELQGDIRAAARQADFVLLSCHWGVSSSPEPVAYQRQIARAAIDAGAALVFGHHPHVLQRIEFHDGKPIFYSLGNFVFDWPKMRGRNRDGVMLRVELANGGIEGIRLLPAMRDEDNELVPLDPRTGDGKRIIDRLAELTGDAASIGVDGPDAVIGPAAQA